MELSGNIFFDGPEGRIEALIKEPAGSITRSAVICHPHPLYGGTMHNKVVFRMARVFSSAGFVALRFNFRGVGKSAGKHDNGRGEQDDLVAAIDFAEQSYPGAQIWLGGFSFGASVMLKVGCRDGRVRALVAAGAPVGAFGFEPVERCEKDKLFVQGSLDQFGPVDALSSFFERLAEPKRLVVIEGSGHFFEGHLDELESAISDFICRLSA